MFKFGNVHPGQARAKKAKKETDSEEEWEDCSTDESVPEVDPKTWVAPGATDDASEEDKASYKAWNEDAGSQICPGRAAIYHYRYERAWPQGGEVVLEARLNPGQSPPMFVALFNTPAAWVYTTIGLSDLIEETDRPGEDERASGFGYEIVYKLAKEDAGAAPAWPREYLARLMTSHKGNFHLNDRVEVRESIIPPSEANRDRTLLTNFFLMEDPALPPLDGPLGRVQFLTLVGVTTAETEASKRWSCEGMAGVLREWRGPEACLVTQLDRQCLFVEKPETKEEVERRAVAEGSSTGVVNGAGLWITAVDGLCRGPDPRGLLKDIGTPKTDKEVTVHLSGDALRHLLFGVKARLSFRREFVMLADEKAGFVVCCNVCKKDFDDEGIWYVDNALERGEWCRLELFLGATRVAELQAALEAKPLDDVKDGDVVWSAPGDLLRLVRCPDGGPPPAAHADAQPSDAPKIEEVADEPTPEAAV